MARVLKIFGIVGAVLLGLVVLAVVVVNVIPGDKYKSLIVSAVQSATGRELAIEGELDVTLFTTASFSASGIKFANADWGSRPHLAFIDRIEGSVALFPLIRGVVDTTLVVDNPDVLLERNSDGRGNWQFDVSRETPEPEGEKATEEKSEGRGLALRPLIRLLRFNGTRIVYLDETKGTRIDIHKDKLEVGSTKDALTLDIKGTYNDVPLALSGGLNNGEFFVDNQPANLKLDGYIGDAKITVQGTTGPLSPSFDLDITANVDTDSIAAFSILAGRELPDIGPLSVSVKLAGKGGKFTVSELLATLKDETITAEAKGAIADLNELSGIRLKAVVNSEHLSEVLKDAGIQPKHPLPDKLDAVVSVEGSLEDLAVKQLTAKIQGRALSIDVNAQAKNIVALKGVTADLLLETASLDVFEQIAKTKLPPFGQFKAMATIASKGESLGHMDIRADITSDIMNADVTGTIGDPLKLKDVDATFNLDVDSLDWLADYINVKLPPLGRVEVKATVAAKDDIQGPMGIKANVVTDILQADVDGSIGEPLKLKDIHADVNLSADSLSWLADYLKMPLPNLGALKASATVASKGESFEIKKINATLEGEQIQATIAASVADVLKLVGIQADVNVSVDSLASIGALVNQELPASGAVKLEGKLTADGGLTSPVQFVAAVKSDGVTANLTGRVTEPLAARGIDVTLDLNAESMEKIGKLAGTPTENKDPVKLAGKFTVGENSIELADLNLMIGKLDAKGQAALKKPADSGGRPLLSLELHIGDIDIIQQQAKRLEAIEIEEVSESDAAKKEGKKADADAGKSKEAKGDEKESDDDKEKKLLPSEPLPFDLLKSMDADIVVTVNSVTTLDLLLEDFATELTLKNGLLSVKPMKAGIGDGAFNGTLTLDARNPPAALAAEIEIDNATFRKFGGKLNFSVDLSGRGESIAAIMGGLNGQIVLDVREATLKKSLLTSFGSSALDKLNPFSKDGDTTELNCAIAYFNVKDGLADANKRIAMQMTAVTWFGNGKINLKTEKIDFSMYPEPRKGLGLDMGGLAQTVGLGGTLTHPKLKVNMTDIGVKHAKWSLHAATGGMTWLAESLWDRLKANSDVCAKILERVEKDELKRLEKEKKEGGRKTTR